MKNTDKKKRICLFVNEETANAFVKRTKQSGITQSFVAEALLKNWLTKPVQVV